jgi:hypothetical protein
MCSKGATTYNVMSVVTDVWGYCVCAVVEIKGFTTQPNIQQSQILLHIKLVTTKLGEREYGMI